MPTSNEQFLLRNRNMSNELFKKKLITICLLMYMKLSDIQKQEIRDYRQSLREFMNINHGKYLIDGVKIIEFPKPPEFIGDIRMPKYQYQLFSNFLI